MMEVCKNNNYLRDVFDDLGKTCCEECNRVECLKQPRK